MKYCAFVARTDKVREHLSQFFLRASRVLMDDKSHELKLCLLFVNCMEVGDVITEINKWTDLCVQVLLNLFCGELVRNDLYRVILGLALRPLQAAD